MFLFFYDFFILVFAALFVYDLTYGTFNIVSFAYPFCIIYYMSRKREVARLLKESEESDDWHDE
jgi:hypothetical protein